MFQGIPVGKEVLKEAETKFIKLLSILQLKLHKLH